MTIFIIINQKIKVMENLQETLDLRYSQIFKKYNCFFAFNKKQYDEQAIKGEKYTQIRGGLLCPSDKANEVIKAINKATDEAVTNQHLKYGPAKIIEYEYFNHETHISGDISTLKESLSTHSELFPEEYSDRAIEHIAQKCYKKAVRQDLF